VIRRSRTVLAMGLALAVGVTGIAIADGAGDNVSTVKGKITPKKLPKKKYKPAALNNGVTTLDADNNPAIPAEATEQVFIDYDDDIKISLGSVTECTQNLEPLDTAGARAACPNSIISIAGSAAARIPGFPTTNNEVADFTVTVFRGEGNEVLLKAHSPTLGTAGGAAPVVHGNIINSPLGGDFGKRLSVPDAPDVASDLGALVRFEATLKKGGVIKARCKDRNKTHNFKARFVYDDDSVDNASAKSKCAVKR
jgi:hypothetical protein